MENKAERFNQMNHLLSVSRKRAEWDYYYTIDLSTGERLLLADLFTDSGDVAPMYMGCVEFVIPNEVHADVRK